MRIVIDLLEHHGRVDSAALALTQELLRRAGAREVHLALPLLDPVSLQTLRASGLLPRERVRAFDLPAGGRVRALVRRHALAGLRPDVVLVPVRALRRHGAATPAAAPLPCPVLETECRGVDIDALLAALDASAGEQAPIQHQAARPRLAYVSPLPPEKSGIADYSAELVPQLAHYYDIELVVEQDQQQVTDPRLAGLPLRDAGWLREHAHEFDHVLYHFGNSHAHKHMFELVREVPGIVVLHDFYLSGVLDNLEREQYLDKGFLQALYESHGYTGVLGHRREGRNPSIWKYPLNKGVLDNALGVIVHSDFSRELAVQWYGPGAADTWRTIALLRGRPEGAMAQQGPAAARSHARERLGLDEKAFVVATFGMLGRTKLNAELLEAFLASPLALDPDCHLVFVGENDPGPYGAQLREQILASPAAGRIRITGFVDAAVYAHYLDAADAAVQLRSSTRGETSAAVLDCLLYGLPTVVNAHGSTASLPDTLLLKLPDEFAVGQLAEALARLRGDPALRSRLGARARAHMAEHHAPAHVGALYRDAIEGFAHRGEPVAYQDLVTAVAPLCPTQELQQLAAAIAFNRAPAQPRQLLVDVSAVVQSDLKTGIQRVVRSILLALIADPPAGFRIEPVYSTGGNRSYLYARRFGLSLVGETELALEDAPVDLHPGDLFFGLDLFTTGTSQNENLLLSMRDRGVGIYFVVFDILPMLRPDVFPFGAEQYFGEFLRTVHKVSDGVLCISRAVADELGDWIERQGLQRRTPLQLGHFHLGADINASAPSFGLPPDADHVLAALGERPSFLMVGTVEPRKGHTQALAAFELLWQRGEDVNLVVVGKQGWMMEKLCERMDAHPEKSRRLFWLPGISDEMLLKLYDGSAALLAPSEGEGFGLPLIEAAQKGIPILARSLPVFREVAGEHAFYFDGLDPQDLASAVSAWLGLQQARKTPQSVGMPWLTWDGSAKQALDALVGQQWYRTLPGTEDRLA
ncbi:glycosyltransferase [Massilia sp. H6]|uniref:glycosyltransferase n=1 Tax=Massilia sp. H6 TaxID=2970464 RepID=UPI002169BBAC|nr:glycosyltransferase [Massilia sp. H6]UVW28143.1 glycosyltransferase [Massilia sp. H6]